MWALGSVSYVDNFDPLASGGIYQSHVNRIVEIIQEYEFWTRGIQKKAPGIDVTEEGLNHGKTDVFFVKKLIGNIPHELQGFPNFVKMRESIGVGLVVFQCEFDGDWIVFQA